MDIIWMTSIYYWKRKNLTVIFDELCEFKKHYSNWFLTPTIYLNSNLILYLNLQTAE